MVVITAILSVYGLAQSAKLAPEFVPTWIRVTSLLATGGAAMWLLLERYEPPEPGWGWVLGSFAIALTWTVLGGLALSGLAIIAGHIVLDLNDGSSPAEIVIRLVSEPFWQQLRMFAPWVGMAVAVAVLPRQWRRCRREICAILHYCVKCDYDLTHNESGRCPECGTPIDGDRLPGNGGA